MINSIKNICVYASSSNYLDECFYKDAEKLGILIGKNGYNIVYGGSRLGLMFTCANAVKREGGKIIGIMPKRLADMGCSNPEDCDEFILTEGMRERKALLDEKSDAVVALAGGFGTLEELAELIVQKQLGYNNKPIVILNTNGFYNDLIKFFDHIIDSKFANKNSKELYFITDSVDEAISYIKNYVPKDIGLKFVKA